MGHWHWLVTAWCDCPHAQHAQQLGDPTFCHMIAGFWPGHALPWSRGFSEVLTQNTACLAAVGLNPLSPHLMADVATSSMLSNCGALTRGT